jgi:hypothetical protein
MDTDHSIFYRIDLIIAKESIIKDLNNFYFTEEPGPNEEKNINYDYNMHTLLKKLQLFLQSAVNEELKKKRSIKTLR